MRMREYRERLRDDYDDYDDYEAYEEPEYEEEIRPKRSGRTKAQKAVVPEKMSKEWIKEPEELCQVLR